MKYIDEKFKEVRPEATVELIKNLLSDLDIELTEIWHNTGIDDCWALRVIEQNEAFGTNGKGVSKEFAAASAYAEFMERLSLGIFLRNRQFLNRDDPTNLNAYAPDARYMTKQELIDNGEWMDYIIEKYDCLTREYIAKLCIAFAGKEPVLTVPYYSLFEDKYVYIPVDFETRIYTANGCCAGNTRCEAWIHGISEIYERHNCLEFITSGKAAPVIPDETLRQYKTISRILDKIKENGNFIVTVFDLSLDTNFPVIATRIIDKKSHSYVVNVGADPIVEIAIQRTLTEAFQGESLDNFSTLSTRIPTDIKEVASKTNILNQIVIAHGIFAADFFAEEIKSGISECNFPDNSDKNNEQILDYMLDMVRKLKKPVYIRNASYLGFPCYRFIIPGFSESRPTYLTDTNSIYPFKIGEDASETLRDIRSAGNDGLAVLMLNRKLMKGVIPREGRFIELAGIPIKECDPANNSDLIDSAFMLNMHYAYACYKLGNQSECLNLLNLAKICSIDDNNKEYAACARQYMEFLFANLEEDVIMSILNKFYKEDTVKHLKYNLEKYGDVFGDYLIKCDFENCEDCKFKSLCHLEGSNKLVANVGAKYKQFVDGQNKENFII